MGINKGAKVCPSEDNTVFVIRKHGTEKDYSPQVKVDVPELSRQTSVNSYQSKSSRLTLDEDLEALRASNMVFIRHLQQNTNVPQLDQGHNKYTIVDSSGVTLFYAVELVELPEPLKSTPSPSVIVSSSSNEKLHVSEPDLDPETEEKERHLKFVVVNTNGEEVYDVDGHTGVKGYGTFATVQRESTVLGNIVQTNKVSSSCPCHRVPPPSYLIETPDGRTVQKILRQSSWKNLTMGHFPVNDFNVYSPDGTICKAKISRQTDAISLEEYSQADTYALSFHTTDMDGKMKALILATVLMLDYQWTENVRDPIDYKSLFKRLLGVGFLILIIIIFIALLVDSSIDFNKERARRFPGQVPSP